jgi:hypothetical protein
MKSTEPNFRVLGLRVARATGANMLTFSKPFLHDPAEVGMDPGYANRSATGKYRTTPLRGLLQHPPYFHDGSAPDLLAVVNHYDQLFDLEARGIGHARIARGSALRETQAQTTPRPAGQMGQLVREIRPKPRSRRHAQQRRWRPPTRRSPGHPRQHGGPGDARG